MEILRCTACRLTFPRPSRRGAKPKLCQNCKAETYRTRDARYQREKADRPKLPDCCEDYRLIHPRGRKCPQHKQWTAYLRTVRPITLRDDQKEQLEALNWWGGADRAGFIIDTTK